MEVLRNTILEFQGHTYVAIDGLDECPQPHRKQLLRLIDQMMHWELSDLHVLVTSQTLNDIEDSLEQPKTVKMA